MVFIKNNRIYITRGDTARLHVNLVNGTGEAYEMQAGSIVTDGVNRFLCLGSMFFKKL